MEEIIAWHFYDNIHWIKEDIKYDIEKLKRENIRQKIRNDNWNVSNVRSPLVMAINLINVNRKWARKNLLKQRNN